MINLTNKLMVVSLSLFLVMFSVSQAAEAKRFGGGKSFGYNKNVAPKNYNKAPQKAPAKPASTSTGKQTKPASGSSKWLGPLAGIAAGGLLAAMLFGDGFEGIQLFDILLFALIAFVLFKIFARRSQSQHSHQPAGYSDYQHSNQHQRQEAEPVQYRESKNEQQSHASQGSIIGADLDDGIGQGMSERAEYFSEIPEWFNAEQFVDGAKSHFVTLQRAWDQVDLSEIEAYCTPDLYTAMKQELTGVNPGDNRTVVDSLDAEIVAMAVDGQYFIVSVRFSGFIEEDSNGAHAFNEIWHIRRLASDEGNWLIAGIQQTNDLP